MNNNAWDKTAPFVRQGFVGALSGLIVSPRHWFCEAFPLMPPKEACGLLVVSSLIYAAAGAMPAATTGGMVSGAILMVNALGMPVMCAAIAWLVGAASGQRICFARILKVFAVGSSPVLLVAWVPFSFFFTEPWKWSLIGLGMIYGLGMGKRRTVVILLATAALTAMFLLAVLRLMALPFWPAT